MKYSYEFKIKAIELHRKGKWIDAPKEVKNRKHFHDEILEWVGMENANGPESLRHKA